MLSTIKVETLEQKRSACLTDLGLFLEIATKVSEALYKLEKRKIVIERLHPQSIYLSKPIKIIESDVHFFKAPEHETEEYTAKATLYEWGCILYYLFAVVITLVVDRLFAVIIAN